MVKKFWITGDTHGAVTPRLDVLQSYPDLVPEETALIVLGDVGLCYYLNKKDQRHKREVESKGLYLYCVRGNHEARPKDVKGLHRIHDENVGGTVWIEDEFPHIRYFSDWGIYNIQGLRTLVVGGAYSVDKYYRIQNNFRWFENELLSEGEMSSCLRNVTIEPLPFDLVLTHTCPLSLQPTDLFLGFIDQSTVDNSMEVWMEKLANSITWKIWLFGHYHQDRIEWPHVEQFYIEIEPLMNIIERWSNYDKTGRLDWWLPLAPRMKRIMEEKKDEEL